LENNLNKSIKIKEGSYFQGSYSGSEDLELNGDFEGTLYVKSLYIKKSGMFIGYVSAQNIIVEGKINADVQAENFHLKSTGIVDGEIIYRNLIIDSGGMLKSSMVQNISKMEKIIKFNKN
jgi:cytoskeletal protein CcmA (bactofilin family)